ncbi:unnamed protein product [Pleuronectes platessa]|uniref:Uncharacterized protein n=1 Tax=Pleuronectes platessa TaxID=8262 RepID=A0A9N7ZDR7_PLEPL|nr:unnamed protein product [Pleuronectes platessa]
MTKRRVGWGEGRDWLAHTLLRCRYGNRRSRRQEQPAGEGREQSGAGEGKTTRPTGCRAICTSFRYRWAKTCEFFWEDLSKRARQGSKPKKEEFNPELRLKGRVASPELTCYLSSSSA